MAGNSVVLHHQTLFITKEDHTKNPGPNNHSRSTREQEFISQIRKCRNMEELKQSHCQILKKGMLGKSSFCSTNLIAACALSDWGSMEYARSILDRIDDPGPFEFNTMIRGHVKVMDTEQAILSYLRMLELGVRPDNFTFPILIKACACHRRLEEGMQIHGHVFKLGLQEDVFSQNSLINLYGKCGGLDCACSVFEQMAGNRSVASWSALLGAHAGVGMWDECLSLFRRLSSGKCWRVEESVLVSVLSSCTHLGALHLGRSIHGYSIRNLTRLNVIVDTCLMDMYAKCGSLGEAMRIFANMRERNRWSYSVMISGLAFHGCAVEALGVFSEMLEGGFEPDGVIYLGVLSACSHAGLVEEGLQVFDRMKTDHRIEPAIEHYGCLVDLMGRAGMVKEAFEFVKKMPIKANAVLWNSLLSACRTHRDVELGACAANNILLPQPENSPTTTTYLTLSNMYAKAEMWDNVAMCRTAMASKGLKHSPGYSAIEVKRKMYSFVSDDMSWPQCEGIPDMLHQMEWQLKFEGYSPDLSQVLFDVSDEEKRVRLSRHSQKLAIAFGLLHTSEGSPIRIVRSMRMCKDCHNYTKLISFIYNRIITVRDRSRFHHFRDGICSCRDYW